MLPIQKNPLNQQSIIKPGNTNKTLKNGALEKTNATTLATFENQKNAPTSPAIKKGELSPQKRSRSPIPLSISEQSAKESHSPSTNLSPDLHNRNSPKHPEHPDICALLESSSKFRSIKGEKSNSEEEALPHEPIHQKSKHASDEEDNKTSSPVIGSPLQKIKEFSLKRSFSFGRKNEKVSEVSQSKQEIVSEAALIEAAELEIKKNEIAISFEPYDHKYLQNIIQSSDITNGLKASKAISLSLNKKTFQNEDLFKALSVFIDLVDKKDANIQESVNPFLKEIFTYTEEKLDEEALKALKAERLKILNEAVKFCALKADSALRRSLQIKSHEIIKGIIFFDYLLVVNKPVIEKLHIEILENNFKFSRICKADVLWVSDKKEKKASSPIVKKTSITIEYEAMSSGLNHKAIVSEIHWGETTKEEEKKAFLIAFQDYLGKLSKPVQNEINK